MAFYDNFVRLCVEKGVSPSAAALEIGIKKSNVTYWKNSRNNPSDLTLAKLSDYFGVPVAELVEEQKENPTSQKADEVIDIDKFIDGLSTAELIEYMGKVAAKLKERGLE